MNVEALSTNILTFYAWVRLVRVNLFKFINLYTLSLTEILYYNFFL